MLFLGNIKDKVWTGRGKELKKIFQESDFYLYYEAWSWFNIGALEIKDLDAKTAIAIKTIAEEYKRY